MKSIVNDLDNQSLSTLLSYNTVPDNKGDYHPFFLLYYHLVW